MDAVCCLQASNDLPSECNESFQIKNWEQGGCYDYFKNYCNGPNLFNEPCKTWARLAPKYSSSVISNVCSMPAYINRSECGCIRADKWISDNLGKNLGAPVWCVMTECANNDNAFRTDNMKGECNITQCNISLDNVKFVVDNANQFNPSFAQKCGQQASTQIKSDSKVEEKRTTTTINQNDIAAIIAGTIGSIVVLILIIIVIIIIYRKNR